MKHALPPTLLSTGDVLRMLNVSREGVFYFIRTRQLRIAARTPSGQSLFDPREVERFAAERERRREVVGQ